MLDAYFIDFLKNNRQSTDPLLLGFSGGPDSTALFHLLLDHKVFFHAAHVDHNWRAESGKEAQLLKEKCQRVGIPFFEIKLHPEEKTEKNWEEWGRNARHAFFKKIWDEKKYEALVLGHHADDQAETVLKRIFEGAHLFSLKGLSAVSHLKGMHIWRPLLEIQKKEIYDWLKKREIFFFQDSTNKDERFLRAKMRQTLLPFLSEHFGKEVSPSLCRLGKYADELKEFTEKIIDEYKPLIEESADESLFDLSQIQPATTFEWRLLLRYFFETQGISVSFPLTDSIIFHLKKKSACIQMAIGKHSIKMEKGKLYLLLPRKTTQNSGY